MNTFDVYPLYPINIVRGRGSFVYDEKGQEYLDFYGGHAVISVGHSHPTYVSAIQEQVGKIGFYSNSVINDLQTNYAKNLGKACGYEDYSLFLINSGAEANENALKLASFHTNKSKVIAFQKAFHGRTSASVRVTDNPSIMAPINMGFACTFLQIGDLEAVEGELERGDVAAIIIEGIQGIAGIYQPGSDFLLGLQDLARKYDACLILDEIQSGFGRSGKFFAHQFVEGLRPDLITVAKGMGNGFPIGGVIIAPHFEAKYGLLGTTFGGNHLAVTAAQATLDIIEDEALTENAASIGEYIMACLKDIDGITEVRGTGLMIGIELPYSIRAIRSSLLLDEHLFVGSASQPNTMRLLPALNIDRSQAGIAVEKIKKLIKVT